VLVKLRDYQAELVDKAVAILRSHRFVYLALETRTGKSPVSIMAASQISQDIIFATKKSIIPSVKVTYSELCQDYPELGSVALQIVSFDSLHKIDHKPGRVIIADEAHSFGAYPKPSRRAVMLWGLSRGCHVIMLSATPSPESWSQVYHQLWAAHSESEIIAGFKNFYAWAKTYVNKDKVIVDGVEKWQWKQKRIGTGQTVNDYSDAKKDIILPLMQPLMLTFTQKAAGFAQTEISEQFLYCDMPEQLALNLKVLKKQGIAHFGEHKVIADTAVSKMSKEHQICSGTVIDEEGNGIIISRHKLPKLKMAMLAFPKIAVFYKFIAEKKNAAGVSWRQSYGGLPSIQ
jgi:hypothetical protein